jgi:hypothetical protein
MPGVDQVYRREDQARFGLNHDRSGDLLLVANEKRWFCYNYWLEDRRAPDFARTVDIHSKPGYDPLELFIDPMITFPWLFVPMKLFRRKVLHQRTLLDVIPLDPKLVKGSHGRIRQPDPIQPVVITQRHHRDDRDQIACQEVRNLILQHLFENEGW